ncbi:DUF805 domain-containing protein [Psychroserpens burtonensis]|uniref:DUF805 domain-containing protein n=1 Tax=Psychroserpens burtonensis TaxID=49278 RepID=UPI000426719C|nr:DUF805 domain-containing protein [Psychroserpens burtonensis]
MLVLFNLIFVIAIAMVSGVLARLLDAPIFMGLYMIYVLGVFIPSLAVAVRRLHDIGKSGWFYFIGLIPLIGSIWLIILFVTEGDAGSNAYGPDPKSANNEDINTIGTTTI